MLTVVGAYGWRQVQGDNDGVRPQHLHIQQVHVNVTLS